jgi:NTE family protein
MSARVSFAVRNRGAIGRRALASACLPALHHAVILGREVYWDSAYSGNPALFPLFYKCIARDVMIVLLQPLTHPNLVIAASDIYKRTVE